LNFLIQAGIKRDEKHKFAGVRATQTQHGEWAENSREPKKSHQHRREIAENFRV
jgi:hypothetical protein